MITRGISIYIDEATPHVEGVIRVGQDKRHTSRKHDPNCESLTRINHGRKVRIIPIPSDIRTTLHYGSRLEARGAEGGGGGKMGLTIMARKYNLKFASLSYQYSFTHHILVNGPPDSFYRIWQVRTCSKSAKRRDEGDQE